MGIMDNAQQFNKYRTMLADVQKETKSTKGTGISKKGYVTIVLDGEKQIKNIEFSDEAMDLKKEDLAKNIKEAYKAAAKEIEKQLKKQLKNSPLASMLSGKGMQ